MQVTNTQTKPKRYANPRDPSDSSKARELQPISANLFVHNHNLSPKVAASSKGSKPSGAFSFDLKKMASEFGRDSQYFAHSGAGPGIKPSSTRSQ